MKIDSDLDGDGYNLEDDCWDEPEGPAGTGLSGEDIHPGAEETWYDGFDQDCDGSDDYDADGDGFDVGTADEDCDDTDPEVNPGATEACNGIDDDCDGAIDDGLTQTIYEDVDDDGFGGESTAEACDVPDGWSLSGGDCDDADPDVNPGATEACDGVDDDCDGTIDDGLTLTTYYRDADGDDYGNPDDSIDACDAPADYVGDGSDCDDENDSVYPGATETCRDGVVNDCDATEEAARDACELRGTVSLTEADLTLSSDESAQHQVGSSADVLGDLNGDGLDDLLIGANRALEYPNADRGGAYVVLGATSLDDESTITDAASFILYGETNDDELGTSVAAAGDVDGDEIPDLLAGAPGEISCSGGDCTVYGTYASAGGVALILGSTALDGGTKTLSEADGIIYGSTEGDLVGDSVAAAGDVDGDGTGDILVASWYHDETYIEGGGVWLVSGADLLAASGAFSLDDASLRLEGECEDAHASRAVAGNVDLDGDGLPDMVVGAPSDDEGPDDGAGNRAGAVYVLLGSSYAALAETAASGSGLVSLADADLKLRGESSSNYAGQSLDPLGDVNGDGTVDLLIGAWGSDEGGTVAGKVYVVLDLSPGASRVLSTADYGLLGETAGDEAGFSASGAGDVDADGRADLLIGVYDESSVATWAGAAYLVLAASLPDGGGTVDLSDADLKLTGVAEEDHAGTWVAGGGDFNGDGFDDFMVSAPYHDDKLGALYLIHGSGY